MDLNKGPGKKLSFALLCTLGWMCFSAGVCADLYYDFDSYDFNLVYENPAYKYYYDDTHVVVDRKHSANYPERLESPTVKKSIKKNIPVIAVRFSREVSVKEPEEAKEAEIPDKSFHVESLFFRTAVYFNFDKDELTLQQREELEKSISSFLKKNSLSSSDVEAEVYGYACTIGKKEYNFLLSKRRAENVAHVLKSMGIRVKEVKGLGPVSKKDVLCMNRMAEVVITASKDNKERGGSRE